MGTQIEKRIDPGPQKTKKFSGGVVRGDEPPGSSRGVSARGDEAEAQGGIAEVPEDSEPRVQIVLKVPDEDAFHPDPIVEVITPFADTHYGTREMTVRDPDGRLWTLQAPERKHG